MSIDILGKVFFSVKRMFYTIVLNVPFHIFAPTVKTHLLYFLSLFSKKLFMVT